MSDLIDNDSIEKRQGIGLALQAAILIKSVAGLVACPSWLLAKLTLMEVRQRIDELAKTVEAGSKEGGKHEKDN